MSMNALGGLIVLEIAEGVAGPICGLQCADLGARVIKIEPEWGDRTREWGPALASGNAAIFEHLNASKQSVVLDGDLPPQLLKFVDAVIVEQEPGAPPHDWRATADAHPSLIVCEIDAVGPKGPLARRAGSELVNQAMSGFTRYVGDPNGPPCRVGFEVAGVATGQHAFQAIMAALLHRARSGLGQYVRVSALGSLLSMKSILFAAQSGDTDDWSGFHLNGPHWPPDTGWDTLDGQITFDFRHGQRDAWAAFCHEVGLGRLTTDPDYEDWRSTIYLGDRRFEFGTPYREVFARMTCTQASEIINRHGGISVKFNDYNDVFANEQVRTLDPLVDVANAPMGARRQFGTPFRFVGEQHHPVRGAAPALGADTASVLAEFDARAGAA